MFCQDVEWITVVSEQREMRSHGEAVHSWLLVCMECRTGLWRHVFPSGKFRPAGKSTCLSLTWRNELQVTASGSLGKTVHKRLEPFWPDGNCTSGNKPAPRKGLASGAPKGVRHVRKFCFGSMALLLLVGHQTPNLWTLPDKYLHVTMWHSCGFRPFMTELCLNNALVQSSHSASQEIPCLFTTARHWSVSWARWIQWTNCYCSFCVASIVMPSRGMCTNQMNKCSGSKTDASLGTHSPTDTQRWVYIGDAERGLPCLPGLNVFTLLWEKYSYVVGKTLHCMLSYRLLLTEPVKRKSLDFLSGLNFSNLSLNGELY
jgi:hypothetical protein